MNNNLIKWENRYSESMDDDDMGRWARIANCGILNNGMPFINGKVSIHQIAWISKLVVKNEVRFSITYYFPSQNKHVFKTIEEAKKEVENSFKFFIENVLKSVGENF